MKRSVEPPPTGSHKTRHCRDCGAAVQGRARFCPACARIRQRRAQREYRKRAYADPLPFGPPTSMAWLGKFSAWSKSSLSYAEYQAAERYAHEKPKKGTKERKKVG